MVKRNPWLAVFAQQFHAWHTLARIGYDPGLAVAVQQHEHAPTLGSPRRQPLYKRLARDR